MSSWVVLCLHVNVLVRCIGVLNEAVSRGIFKNEGEGVPSPINEFLDPLNELINLGCCCWIVLSAFLLQVLETVNSLTQEAL